MLLIGRGHAVLLVFHRLPLLEPYQPARQAIDLGQLASIFKQAGYESFTHCLLCEQWEALVNEREHTVFSSFLESFIKDFRLFNQEL